jgi:hypothetical protein
VKNKKAVKTNPGGNQSLFTVTAPQSGSEFDLTAFMLGFHALHLFGFYQHVSERVNNQHDWGLVGRFERPHRSHGPELGFVGLLTTHPPG